MFENYKILIFVCVTLQLHAVYINCMPLEYGHFITKLSFCHDNVIGSYYLSIKSVLIPMIICKYLQSSHSHLLWYVSRCCWIWLSHVSNDSTNDSNEYSYWMSTDFCCVISHSQTTVANVVLPKALLSTVKIFAGVCQHHSRL